MAAVRICDDEEGLREGGWRSWYGHHCSGALPRDLVQHQSPVKIVVSGWKPRVKKKRMPQNDSLQRIFGQDVNYQISNERALLKTQNGIVIVAFMNLREKRNWK